MSLCAARLRRAVERSEMGQDRFGLADLEAARCLDGEMRHLAVLRDQRVALAARSHAAADQVQLQPESPW